MMLGDVSFHSDKTKMAISTNHASPFTWYDRFYIVVGENKKIEHKQNQERGDLFFFFPFSYISVSSDLSV